MGKAEVYFAGIRSRSAGEGLLEKLGRLFDISGINTIVDPEDQVAVKVHVGERGCTRFIRHIYTRRLVAKIREVGGHPFIGESCSWGIKGVRSTAQGLIQVAAENGFTAETLGAPFVVADGEIGLDDVLVKVDGNRLKEAYVAKAFADADAMVVVTHFKVGVIMGFSGVLKNLGVGCASKTGKWASHAYSKPKVVEKRCNGCGVCVVYCPVKAIVLHSGKAFISEELCRGCNHCREVCPLNAVSMETTSFPEIATRIVDVAAAVVNIIGSEKIGYFNFVMDVTPRCDCNPFSDLPIIPDIGILASKDPVAVDKASADLVIRAPGVPGSAVDEVDATGSGVDKFTALNKQDWRLQLKCAEKLGLGTMDYTLVPL